MLSDNVTALSKAKQQTLMPLFWWQGYSCAWYVTSVFDLNRFDCPEKGVYLVVRRETDGRRTPLLVGMAENVSDALFSDHGRELLQAIKAGATEVHVHLAGRTHWQDDEVLADLAAGWELPQMRSLIAA